MKLPTYQISLPASVRFDKRLPATVKLLYGEIKALCDQQGYCWAGNEYLASLYQVEPKVISRWISKLKTLGYLKVEVTKGNQRKIYVQSDPPKKDSPPPCLVEDIHPKVPGDLPKDRRESASLLNTIFIDYNDRVCSALTPDSSTKKLRVDQGKSEVQHQDLSGKISTETNTDPTPQVAPVPPPQDQKKTPAFVKPTVPQVEAYMSQQKDLCPDVFTARGQALRFVNYYESNGWKVGRNPMQDWQAAANNWLLKVPMYHSTKPTHHDSNKRYHTGGKQDYSIPL